MSYQDQWSRYHDKPTDGVSPSSNNGWIYTAYAKKLGFKMDYRSLRDCFYECYRGRGIIDRSPYKKDPPISRDEILGLFYLRFLITYDLDGWRFCPYDIPRFNLFKLISEAISMIGAHRNDLWRGEGKPQLWRFAFSVPIQDRAFILRLEKRKVPLFYRLYEWIDKRITKKSVSSKMIGWLKYEETYDPAVFEEYFGPDHIFVRSVVL